MKTPLAIYNLWHQGAKTLVSIGGVAFALLLVFMQLGFKGAVSYTATNVLEKVDFDILVRPAGYLHLYEANAFDRQWLDVARNTEGVEAALPMWVMIQNWRKMPTGDIIEAGKSLDFESQYLPIAVLSFDVQEDVFFPEALPEVGEYRSALLRANTLLLDDSTKSDYGPWDGKQFTDYDATLSADPAYPMRAPEVSGQEYQIAGLFELGTGLAANAAAIMGPNAFQRVFPWDMRDKAVLGLIRVDDGIDPQNVVAALRERAAVGFEEAPAISVMTREEALEAERNYWLWDQPIGLIFQMGVVISLLVGAAIVYMVLSTDVANRLPEYATLMAMGYSRGYLVGIVMTQAVVLCACGFVTAWIGAEGLYRATSSFSGIPLIMDAFKITQVGVLGLVMCCVSGMLALRKLWKAEPASLF
ncbi:MAG: ABC transporter permease [Pirellulaceae bacterium]